MNNAGDTNLLARTRAALLDALEALTPHGQAVVVIGAQAIYLHTGTTTLALAEATKDSDLAVDPRVLAIEPLIEDAMRAAGFRLDPDSGQPGAWLNLDGIPVDLLVPDSLARRGGRRGARVPPHSRHAMRRAAGLEAAVADCSPIRLAALTPDDHRVFTVNVASPAALLVAKMHKLGEREQQPRRLEPKDAHDVYRLLAAIPLNQFTEPLLHLLEDPLAAEPTRQALRYLRSMFAEGPRATGSVLAGQAEQGIGDPEVVSTSVAVLAQDLLAAIQR